MRSAKGLGAQSIPAPWCRQQCLSTRPRFHLGHALNGSNSRFWAQGVCGSWICDAAFCRWVSEVRRVGEASNPGPEPLAQVLQTWRSANITGFCHVEAALAWKDDLLGVTELRGSPDEAAKA